ncbi:MULTISPECIES: hypothetical protein, partial [Rhizobium]|uniref:hypothetical protein n=1 Tax=Rhizobium TaxID=379 RepID=UPI001AEF1DC3
LVPIQCLQQIAHKHGESSTIITVKTKLAPMGTGPSMTTERLSDFVSGLPHARRVAMIARNGVGLPAGE